ncbi:DUF4181 domain-containing protein [Sporosarcina sp. ZBG7A]|uniref:DUF4181 domain-containing protein n=1 Tax=Sporosarcina sp. ZBG7A TaxID=1582223 RepID=UPI00057AEFC4|nr:DUF4181 domain-containing protein [Sporosarcina sp. ZBG7A]
MDFSNYMLLTLMIGFSLVQILTEYVTRKLLKTEKKSILFNQYVSDKYFKIEWILRGVSLAGLVVMSYIYLSTNAPIDTWFTILLFYMLFMNIVNESVTAYMEKKYAKSKNQYIATLIEMVLFSSFLLCIMVTNLLGLLP